VRLWGSLSFRLTILYALVFGLSVTLLMTVYYFVNVRQPIEAIKVATVAQSDALAVHYRADDPSDLIAALQRRANTPAGRTPYHALISKDGRVLTKNLPSWSAPAEAGWLMIEADTYYNGEDNDHMALVYDRRLPDGARLLVGLDIEDLRERQATVFDATRWMIGGGLLFGLLGGILMSRAIGQRIESIGATARRVMTGNLDERIPTHGSGDDFDQLAETLNLMLHRIEQLLEYPARLR
jgi:methyl-accepting chemotaxis protein